jgi:hypothetical protein
LANANVTVSGGGTALRFLGTSSGGQAAVTLTNSGELRFQSYTGAGTTIGSLSGSGTVFLTDNVTSADKTLTIGANDQSTTFSGRIRQGGSIVKQGTGTLTLTGSMPAP